VPSETNPRVRVPNFPTILARKFDGALGDPTGRPKKKLSPTRLVKCERAAYFEMFGYGQRMDPIGEMRLTYGTLRHENVQRYLKSEGHIMLALPDLAPPTDDPVEEYLNALEYLDALDDDIEEWVYWDDPPIHGKYDGTVITSVEGVNGIFEFKTTDKKPDEIKAPFPAHVDQATLYMAMKNFSFAIILYESKAKLPKRETPWKQFVVRFDAARAEALFDKGRRIMRSVEKRQAPPCTGGNYCFDCQYNPYTWSADLQKSAGLAS
jgi:CRISPR/Cas system-associated exonuclease Cas4 (RecB family)